MNFEFHAAAPPGEWINDPNGLVFSGGRYRLFVQHRSDRPAFTETGWARLSSDDLLHWDWDGPVLPPTQSAWAYSGSVLAKAGGELEAHFTMHAAPPAAPHQRQVRVVSRDSGLTWTDAPHAGSPSGRNVRDPFVFAWPSGGHRMLLAKPCDWTDWRGGPSSTLAVLASEDGAEWTEAGVIGPWSPPGVLWEVPVLARFGETWALIISFVDRRAGVSECSVRYWLGGFDGRAFTPSLLWPKEGRLLDLGPDFYAAMLNTELGWPTGERTLVGWASNWRTASRIDWPGGSAGGPITLPRRLHLDTAAERLRQTPEPASLGRAADAWVLSASTKFGLVVRADESRLWVRGDPASGRLSIERTAPDQELSWRGESRRLLTAEGERHIVLFIDAPLVEAFIMPEGLAITAALNGREFAWTLER